MTDSRPNPKPNPDTPFLGPAELSQLPAWQCYRCATRGLAGNRVSGFPV